MKLCQGNGQVSTDLMKSGAHTHMICPLHNLPFSKRLLFLKKRKIQAGTSVNSRQWRSDRKENESIEHEVVSEIGNLALYDVLAIGNYQQAAAAKHAEHLYGIELDIVF